MEAQRHLKVVRPKNGEAIELFDGAGSYRKYVFRTAGNARLPTGSGSCISADGDIQTAPRRATGMTLFACITKGSRWDWTVEKATELGVERIVPVLSARCIVQIPPGERAAKQMRWRRIAEEAARQSDAKWVPEVTEVVDFGTALALASECACFAGALTQPPPKPLLEGIRNAIAERGAKGKFGIFVGPEGDFTPEELEALLNVAVPANFGPTILRAETAAMFGVSVLSAALSEVE